MAFKMKKSPYPFKSPLKGYEKKVHAHARDGSHKTYDKTTMARTDSETVKQYYIPHGGGPTVKDDDRVEVKDPKKIHD